VSAITFFASPLLSRWCHLPNSSARQTTTSLARALVHKPPSYSFHRQNSTSRRAPSKKAQNQPQHQSIDPAQPRTREKNAWLHTMTVDVRFIAFWVFLDKSRVCLLCAQDWNGAIAEACRTATMVNPHQNFVYDASLYNGDFVCLLCQYLVDFGDFRTMRLFTVRAARGLGLPKKNCRSRHRCLISSRRMLCGNQNQSALNAQWHYFECIHIAVLNIRTYTGLSTIVHAWLHSATIPSWLCCTDSRPNIPTPSPALHPHRLSRISPL
jgi:hypothetical protein